MSRTHAQNPGRHIWAFTPYSAEVTGDTPSQLHDSYWWRVARSRPLTPCLLQAVASTSVWSAVGGTCGRTLSPTTWNSTRAPPAVPAAARPWPTCSVCGDTCRASTGWPPRDVRHMIPTRIRSGSEHALLAAVEAADRDRLSLDTGAAVDRASSGVFVPWAGCSGTIHWNWSRDELTWSDRCVMCAPVNVGYAISALWRLQCVLRWCDWNIPVSSWWWRCFYLSWNASSFQHISNDIFNGVIIPRDVATNALLLYIGWVKNFSIIKGQYLTVELRAGT